MSAPALPKAPTSCEASDLTATHVSCGVCETYAVWDPARPASAWSCTGEGLDEEPHEPTWEHHSATPLGFRDDKKCHWGGYTGPVTGIKVPDVWIYYAKAPV